MYSPVGKIFILQPDSKSSPPHPLLPPDKGFYALDSPSTSPNGGDAMRAFLNVPHPLEILSDPTAYGSEGAIIRDHDSSNYLRVVNALLRDHHPKKMVAPEEARKKLQRPSVMENTSTRLAVTNEIMSGV